MDLEQDKIEERERLSPPTALEDRPKKMGLVLRGVSRARNTLLNRSSQLPAPTDAPEAYTAPKPTRKSHPYLWSFILVVALPSFLALLYFVFIASDQYQSEARFAVRAAAAPEVVDTEKEGGGAPAGTNSFAFTASSQNAYIVTSYIRSRAIIDDIDPELNVKEIFQRPEADFLAALQPNASIDKLTDYWKGMVDASVDPISNIVTVEVTAFRANDALRLNQAILKQSENLINSISDRARRDATQSAEVEVRQAFGKLQASLQALQDFRNKDAIIDPTQSSSQIGNLLMPLLTEQLKLKNDEAVMSAELGPDAPSLKAVRSRIASLETQITNLRGQLTGSDSRTVATSLAKFEELDVERILNERKYARAQADLDRAEVRARRQAIYFSVFVPPSQPEYAQFPLRFIYSFIIFATLLILWSIGSLTYASVEDHRL